MSHCSGLWWHSPRDAPCGLDELGVWAALNTHRPALNTCEIWFLFFLLVIIKQKVLSFKRCPPSKHPNNFQKRLTSWFCIKLLILNSHPTCPRRYCTYPHYKKCPLHSKCHDFSSLQNSKSPSSMIVPTIQTSFPPRSGTELGPHRESRTQTHTQRQNKDTAYSHIHEDTHTLGWVQYIVCTQNMHGHTAAHTHEVCSPLSRVVSREAEDFF